MWTEPAMIVQHHQRSDRKPVRVGKVSLFCCCGTAAAAALICASNERSSLAIFRAHNALAEQRCVRHARRARGHLCVGDRMYV